MATTKEVAGKKKKSTSAPASPPKLQEQPHRRSRTVPDAHQGDIEKKIAEQPTPRYLKPTISSCHDTNCHYPKHQQTPKPCAADVPAAAGRRLASRKPAVDKVRSPTSSASQKTASAKERAARTTASSSTAKTAAPSKTPVAVKAAPMKKTRSQPKLNQKSKEPAVGAASATNEVMEPDAVPPMACGSENQIVDANPSQPTEIKDVKGKHDAEMEDELDSGRREREERKVAVAEAVAKVEAKNTALKKQDGSSGRKESPPAYNEVIEEAANKLASRRNKVRALAGAFETVISLQKPETHSNQQQEEAPVAKSGTGDDGGKDERQEEQELKNGGDGSQKETASTMKGEEEGQQNQLAEEKLEDGQEGDAEMREDDEVVNVEVKSTEEPTTESPDEHEQI